MTREEAKLFMQQNKGVKIKHVSFMYFEYVYIHPKTGQMVDEDDNYIDKFDFWKMREASGFDKGWSVVED